MTIMARRWTANLAALGAVIAAALLRSFPPTSAGFYPRCPIFFWTHLRCPGCGGTRALAALLRGRWAEALHWNAMVVTFLPLVAVFLGITYWRAVHATEFRWPCISNRWLAVALAGICVFTVIRNLPFS